MIPVIGSVLGRPEAGSRPSERRECGLETQKMIPVIGSVHGRPEAGSRPSDRRSSRLIPTVGAFGGFKPMSQEDGGLMDPLDGRGHGADGLGQNAILRGVHSWSLGGESW